MINLKNIYIVSFCALLTLSSCNKFLDVLPDKRAELNSTAKVNSLLISAYPNVDPMMIYEHRTDNAMDNGIKFGNPNFLMIEQDYLWKDCTQTSWDEPEPLWNSCYRAIATANQALIDVAKLPQDNLSPGIRGEALLCRAYSHFLLANTFCKPYSAATAKTDLGIPYVTQPESHIGVKYKRGTLQEVYDNLEKDIEEGYSLVNDNNYAIPIYHFTKRAAAAFACRFFLYKGDFKKALKYANLAIPADPSAQLRDIQAYALLPQASEWRDRFISKEEPANLLLIALRSLWGRGYTSARYGNSGEMSTLCTYRSSGPWGRMLKSFDLLFGGSAYPIKFQPKYAEIFEITNQTARTGQPHVVQMAFTTDETLLNRAEAEVMLKDYDAAARDLSYWYVKKQGHAATADQIVDYYTKRAEDEKAALASGSLKPWFVLVKDLHPVNQTLEPGKQTMMMQAVLHARRIETMFSGLRWLDVRRFGIEVVHNRAQADPITLPPGDPRRVIQLPQTVISAGLPANPSAKQVTQ